MASSKEYLEFILGQLSELEEITYRAMMGEFIIYYRGKIVGGIYDDRLLVKPVKAAISYMPTAPYELPYDDIISWADMYDSASTESKKMIVSCLIRRVEVYRDYRLHIDFNIDFEQFSAGLDISAIAA